MNRPDALTDAILDAWRAMTVAQQAATDPRLSAALRAADSQSLFHLTYTD